MTQLLLANALEIAFLVAMIAVPLVAGIGSYLLSIRPQTASERIHDALAANPKQMAKVCPNCGSEDAKKKAGDDYYLVNLERVCSDCGTEYSYPPSRRMGISFIASGIGLVLGASAFAAYVFYEMQQPRGPFFALGLSAVGARTIVSGMEKLLAAGPVKTRPWR